MRTFLTILCTSAIVASLFVIGSTLTFDNWTVVSKVAVITSQLALMYLNVRTLRGVREL